MDRTYSERVIAAFIFLVFSSPASGTYLPASTDPHYTTIHVQPKNPTLPLAAEVEPIPDFERPFKMKAIPRTTLPSDAVPEDLILHNLSSYLPIPDILLLARASKPLFTLITGKKFIASNTIDLKKAKSQTRERIKDKLAAVFPVLRRFYTPTFTLEATAPGIWPLIARRFTPATGFVATVEQSDEEAVLGHIYTVLAPWARFKKHIDKGARLKNRVAQRNQVAALFTGIGDYKKDLRQGKIALESLAATGDERGIKLLIEKLFMGQPGFTQDLPRAYRLMKQRTVQPAVRNFQKKNSSHSLGSPEGEQTLPSKATLSPPPLTPQEIHSLTQKIYTIGFDARGDAATKAKELNEILVREGNREAIHRKISGLSSGFYGYKKNITEAVDLNDTLIQLKDSKAAWSKLLWLAYGIGEYPKTPSKIKNFLRDHLEIIPVVKHY